MGSTTDVESLRSFSRRLLVLTLESTFAPIGEQVDIAQRRFLEDPSLDPFLEGEEARYAYVRYFLLPRRKKYTRADLIMSLTSPTDRIRHDTIAFVRKMANGGMTDPDPLGLDLSTGSTGASSSNDAPVPVSQSEELVCKVHAGAAGLQRLTSPTVCRMTFIPGLQAHPSKKGKNSRVDTLRDAVRDFPYLLPERADGTYLKLDIDCIRFCSLLDKYGRGCFGGWGEWGVMWDLKTSVRLSFYEGLGEEDCQETASDLDACELDELVNVARLRRRAHAGNDRRPGMLAQYIRRCETEGLLTGDFAVVRVGYYRKHELPGRLYARGPALQKLTQDFS